MKYFINDSVYVESKARALIVAKQSGSTISVYDACGLWRKLDSNGSITWERNLEQAFPTLNSLTSTE
jgi:hypothetical protein